MSILLAELIAQVPSDTEEQVERAKSRLNTPVREFLRQETALRLKREAARPGSSRRDSTSVRVYLEAALPTSIFDKELDDNYWLAVHLAPWQHALRSLRDSSRTVGAEVIGRILGNRCGESIVAGRDALLTPVHDLAESLLREAERFDLVRWVLAVNEDVLGTYTYPVPPRHAYLAEPRIDLYWGVIGLVAQVLGVSAEDLTAVVLAHELAHAYTHLGFDIDGSRWSGEGFAASDHALKEGLAQYYTAQACERLADQTPGMKRAYEELLRRQPNAYHTHLAWVDYSSEEVRLAVIETRRAGRGSLEKFEASLDSARVRLRRQSPGAVDRRSVHGSASF